MSDCSPMVHIWKASGDQMATLALADVGSVRTLKQHLQTLCGVSRFRQRLLLRGETLADEAQLASSPSGALDVQLVLLPFVSTSVWEVHDLTSRVATGSERQVEEILLRPQDPNLLDIWGNMTPLIAASLRNQPRMARLLLEAGADVNFIDDLGKTPLSIACESAGTEMVEILLNASADTERCDISSRTPLWFATFEGHSGIVKLLLSSRARTDALDDNGGTPLLVASQRGFGEVASLLLEAGADKSAVDNDGYSPVASAHKYGHLDIVRMLADESIESSLRSESSHRPRKRPAAVLKRPAKRMQAADVRKGLKMV